MGAAAATWWKSRVGEAVDAWRQQVASLSGRPPRAGSSGPDQVLPGRSRVDSLRRLNRRTAMKKEDLDFLHSCRLSAGVYICFSNTSSTKGLCSLPGELL